MSDGATRNQSSARFASLLLSGLIAVMLLPGSAAQTQSAPAVPTPSAPKTAAAPDIPAPAPIPLPEVATEAEAALARIRELAAELPASRTMPAVVEQFPLLTREIDARLRQTRRILSQRPSLQVLGDLEKDWRPLRRNLARWRRDLTTYLSRLESEAAELDELRNVWQQTLEAAKASNAPPEVLGRIQVVIAEIEKAREVIDRHTARALTLQNRVAAQDTRIADALALIAQTRENALDRIFMPDSVPIWSLDMRSHSTQELRAERSRSFAMQWESLSAYAARQMPSFLIHAAIFVGIGAGFRWLRRRVQPRLEEEPGTACSAIVCETPIAAAFLLSTFFSRWIYPQAPRLLWALLGALALIPSAIVLRRLIVRDLYPALYGLAIFYIVDQVRTIAAAEQFLPRLLLLGEMLGIMAFLVWLLRSIDPLDGQTMKFGRLNRIIKVAASLAFVVAAAAFIANATGYVTLANLLGNAILSSAYFALVLYALIELMDSLVMIAFRPPTI
jgi:potassium-dependent mechanosensitive channel